MRESGGGKVQRKSGAATNGARHSAQRGNDTAPATAAQVQSRPVRGGGTRRGALKLFAAKWIIVCEEGGLEPSDISDDQLMAMFRHGNRSAFELLFERHRREVFNFARRMIGERAAAEDACQETFLRLVTGAQGYRPEGRFRAWLFRIARNCCLQTLRRRHGPQVELDGVASVQESPPDAADRIELERRLEAAIGRLPEAWREVFLMRYRHGLEYREIAEATGQPLGTVKTHIHRARTRLAEEVG